MGPRAKASVLVAGHTRQNQSGQRANLGARAAGEDAIVLSTDVNKTGRRERETFRTVGGGYLIVGATNTLAQASVEAEK